jgi:mono/diheme cytochrome c family protein
MRRVALIVFFLLAQLAAVGCDRALPEIDWQRMIDQPRGKAYAASPFFANSQLMQMPPAGTIPATRASAQTGLESGKLADRYLPRIPLPIDRALLTRGRSRFEIFCAGCHGIDGSGESFVAHQMSLRAPPSLLVDPVRGFAPGQIFEVITHGFGLMPPYAQDLSARDRWAVVSYLHALQRSRASVLAELPASIRGAAQEALR